jgi:hypothetical protein
MSKSDLCYFGCAEWPLLPSKHFVGGLQELTHRFSINGEERPLSGRHLFLGKVAQKGHSPKSASGRQLKNEWKTGGAVPVKKFVNWKAHSGRTNMASGGPSIAYVDERPIARQLAK